MSVSAGAQVDRPLRAAMATALPVAGLTVGASLLVGTLFYAAHVQNGCSASVGGSADCGGTDGANGLLGNVSAVLWSIHGAGLVIGVDVGAVTAHRRLPLALGMALVALALFARSRAVTRRQPPLSLRDVGRRAVLTGVVYAAVMIAAGAVLTARGDGYTVGPDDVSVVTWCFSLGTLAAGAGSLRELAAAVDARTWVRAVVRARLRRWWAAVEAAFVGLVAGLAASLAFAVVAMIVDHDTTAAVLRTAFEHLTGRAPPDSFVSVVAASLLVALAAPTIAVWTFLAACTVPIGVPGSTVVGAGRLPPGQSEFGLHMAATAQPWLGVVAAVPVLTLLAVGVAAARRVGARGPVRGAAWGLRGGIVFGGALFGLAVLLDGGQGISSSGSSQNVQVGLAFGPALDSALGICLVLPLLALVGGAGGGIWGRMRVAAESLRPADPTPPPRESGPEPMPPPVTAPPPSPHP